MKYFLLSLMLLVIIGVCQSVSLQKSALVDQFEQCGIEVNSEETKTSKMKDNEDDEEPQVVQPQFMKEKPKQEVSEQKQQKTEQVQQVKAQVAPQAVDSANPEPAQKEQTVSQIIQEGQALSQQDGDTPQKKDGKTSYTEIDLENIQGQQYIGKLWFGQPLQEMPVQYDTGSSSLYLITDACQSSECASAKFKKYVSKKSSYFQAERHDRSEIQYGKGYIAGSAASDMFCFSNDEQKGTCMSNFNFLAVDEGTDLNNDRFSGIVGLSPNKIGAKGIDGFLTQLSTRNVVDPVFSFYLTKNGAPGSKITFGGYDAERFGQAGAQVKWVDIDASNMNYWSLPMNGNQIRFGEEENANKTAKITSSNVILDTGLSYALIPSKDVQTIAKLIKNNYDIDCKTDKDEIAQRGSNLAFLTCDYCSDASYKRIQPLNIMIGGSWVQIPKEAFIHQSDSEQGTCKLILTSSDMDTSGSQAASGDFFGDGGSQNWLLGDQFLQQFYTIYDYKNKKVGLVESK